MMVLKQSNSNSSSYGTHVPNSTPSELSSGPSSLSHDAGSPIELSAAVGGVVPDGKCTAV